MAADNINKVSELVWCLDDGDSPDLITLFHICVDQSR